MKTVPLVAVFSLCPTSDTPPDGTAPHVTTQAEMEDAFTDLMRRWPGRNTLFPRGNPRLGPPNPFMRSPFEGVSPQYL